jgi:hypothetical protein
MSPLPEFKSSIPENLLNSLEPKEKYIFEQISIMGQKTDWLIGETGQQNHALSIIKTETQNTNGKVAQSIRDIAELQRKNAENSSLLEEVKKIVDIKQFLGKLLSNKLFWFSFIIFIVGAVKILMTPELLELFKKLIGIS